MNIKKFILVVLVVMISFVLRFYKVWQYPVSLYWDEVAIGYNAYSILTTGKDEYGKFLPLQFESFQEYKLPGYIYSVVISEIFFGPTELGVRIPSVVFGTLSTLILFFLVLELFDKNSHKQILALTSSLFYAISPWSIQFNRAGFEASGGLFFGLLGIYLYLFWLRTNKKLVLSSLSIGISFYFYYQQRFFFPVFVLLLAIIFRNTLRVRWNKVIIALIIFLIVITPLIMQQFDKSSQIRLSQISVFSQEYNQKEITAKVLEGNTIGAKLIHSKPVWLFFSVLKNYLSYYSFEYLFINGDANARHGVKDMGVVYLPFIVLFVFGLGFLFRGNLTNKKILYSWLLIAPLPAAFSMPNPHALRSLFMSPAIDIVCALGIIGLLNYLNVKYLRRIFCLVIISLSCYFMFRYLHLYYIHEKERSLDWADGYKNLFSYLSQIETNYDYIYVTGKYWRPYIFMLFYNKYTPQINQLDPFDNKIGKYYFGYASYDTTNPRYNYNDLNLSELRNLPKSILALSPDETLPEEKVTKTIYSVSGKPVFYLIEK